MELKIKIIAVKAIHVVMLAAFFFFVYSFLYPLLGSVMDYDYKHAKTVAAMVTLIFFLGSLYFEFKREKAVVYEIARDFIFGLMTVVAVWFLFSLGVAYLIQSSFLSLGYQRPYMMISSVAGIVGVLFTFYAALKLKIKAFMAGVVIGGIFPIYLSGNCMLNPSSF